MALGATAPETKLSAFVRPQKLYLGGGTSPTKAPALAPAPAIPSRHPAMAIRLIPKMLTTRAGLPVDSFSKAYPPSKAATLLRKRGHTHAEYLHPNGPQRTKLYLDRDAPCLEYKDRDKPPPQSLIDAELAAVSVRVGKMLGVMHSMGISGATAVYAQRHGFDVKTGAHKLSLRVFFSGVTATYIDIPAILQDVFEERDGFWDLIPYKANEQLVCAVFGKKGTIMVGSKRLQDDRVLIPVDPALQDVGLNESDLLKFVVQHVEPGWPNLYAPTARPSAAPIPKAVRKGPAQRLASGPAESDLPILTPEFRIRSPVDFTEVMELVSILNSSRAAFYDPWIKVGFCLHNISERAPPPQERALLNAWIDFSKLCPAKFVLGECEDKWAGMKFGTARIGSLIYWARMDDSGEYRDLMTRRTSPCAMAVTTLWPRSPVRC